jgi:mannose-6-phosphate isomerase-like protein (cupin superfamily)
LKIKKKSRKILKISERLIASVAKRFPGAKIVRIPEKNPKEVVFEIMKDPKGQFGVAVAIIAESKPHLHKKTWEGYRVLDGELALFYDGQHKILGPSQEIELDGHLMGVGFYVIHPNQHHWAKAIGKPAIVLVVSSPAWSPEDHHLSEA